MQPEFKRRLRKLRRQIKQLGITAFLVTNATNIRYLTGFTGSSASLIVTRATEYLLSDSRYESQLTKQCSEIDVVIRDAQSTMLDSIHSVVRDSNFSTLGIESDSIAKSYYDQLTARLIGTTLVDTNQIVETFRMIKDKTEINAIRKSIRINERAFQVIRSQLAENQTELQIAHNLEHQMRAFGAKRCAFEPIVGVGERSALPHGFPSNKKIGEGKWVLMDWGAEVEQYTSDLTRVLFTSKIPTRFRRIYETVLAAQIAAIEAVRPGKSFKNIDSAARNIIQSAGFGPQFGHGLGHGFGLEIHEAPYLSPIHDGTLKPGMVITIEPGIYIPGLGGVRIEDDVLVTPDGFEVLSNLPKQIDECTVDLRC